MKMVLAMRSDMAFELVYKSIQLSKSLIGIQLPKENVSTVEQLEDYILFYEAEVYVIDKSLTNSSKMIEIVEEKGLKAIVIEDIKAVVKVLEEEYGTEQVEESFKIFKPIIEEKEKETVKVETKIVEKEVFVSKIVSVPQKTILIGSLYSNAGSTIVAMNLARMIAERGIDVAYIENPLSVPRMYDYLQIEYSGENYVDLAQNIKHDIISNDEFFYYKGVKWIVNDPNKQRIKEFSFNEFNLLLQLAKSTITILDISNYYTENAILKLSQFADEVILVMEANPIKNEYHILNPNHAENVFYQFENNQVKYKILLSKTNIKGLDIKTVKEMLPQRTFLDLPYINYEYLVKNLFESKIFYDDVENHGKEFVEKYMKELINLVLPKEYVPLKGKNKSTIIHKLFKRG